MRESRIYKIEDKILTVTDVFKISNLIELEYKKTKRVNKYASFEITINYDDDSSYQSEESLIFKSDLVKLKKANSIEITFASYHADLKSISCNITHGNSRSYNNRIKITGKDSDWVNGILAKLIELVDSFKPQMSFIPRKHKWLFAPTTLVFGYAIMYILMNTYSLYYSKTTVNPLNYIKEIYFWGGIIFFGSIFSPIVLDSLNDLYPIVELQVGPDHTYLENHRRKSIWLVITLIIIPIILTAIFK